MARVHLAGDAPDLDAMLGASRTTCSILARTCARPRAEGGAAPKRERLRVSEAQVERLEDGDRPS